MLVKGATEVQVDYVRPSDGQVIWMYKDIGFLGASCLAAVYSALLRPSYLHNGISYTGKLSPLYWIRAQLVKSYFGVRYGVYSRSYKTSGKTCNCASASKATPGKVGSKQNLWYEHNRIKHNKTVYLHHVVIHDFFKSEYWPEFHI